MILLHTFQRDTNDRKPIFIFHSQTKSVASLEMCFYMGFYIHMTSQEINFEKKNSRHGRRHIAFLSRAHFNVTKLGLQNTLCLFCYF